MPKSPSHYLMLAACKAMSSPARLKEPRAPARNPGRRGGVLTVFGNTPVASQEASSE